MSDTPLLYVVHAFTDRHFEGNPAAVCISEEPLPEAAMQRVAAELKLSETAFLVPDAESEQWHLRWFTPVAEVELCGHATLAAAYVLFHDVDPDMSEVVFLTKSGPLRASWHEGEGVWIDLPARVAEVAEAPEALVQAVGCPVLHSARREARWMLRTDSEATVRALAPRLDVIAREAPGGLIVTAPGASCDVVSRYFAPALGVPEDPVTGSAHAMLVPYWSGELGKHELQCAQVGPRGGSLLARLKGERVHLRGEAVLFMRGELAFTPPQLG